MNAGSIRNFFCNSSTLLRIAYEYKRPIPFTLNPKRLIWHSIRYDRLYKNHRAQTATSKRPKKHKASLIIFDKDGTLICFHSTWVPWARNLAKKLSKAVNMNVEKETYSLLGLHEKEQRVQSGLLAEGTMTQIRDAIARLLVERGIESSQALKHAEAAVAETNESTSHSAKELFDSRSLLRRLRENGVKIAICTADNRKRTLSTLKQLQLEDYIDMIVCGDDAGSIPKPHPHNALSICRTLDIDPQDTLVVGDTLADMSMGRSANLGSTVGVLSGVCDINELQSHADYIVRDAGELLSIVMDMRERHNN